MHVLQLTLLNILKPWSRSLNSLGRLIALKMELILTYHEKGYKIFVWKCEDHDCILLGYKGKENNQHVVNISND